MDYVQSDFDGTTVSKYDYTNDAAGRRTDVERSGTAFDATDTLNYNYNSRPEVMGAESSTDSDYDFSYAFERAMRRGQDYESHFDKDYRWDPFGTFKDLGFVHAISSTLHKLTFGWLGENPDADEDAWEDAEEWTHDQVDSWKNKWCN